MLSEGDKVDLYINDEFFDGRPAPAEKIKYNLDIVYEDENIILINKNRALWFMMTITAA